MPQKIDTDVDHGVTPPEFLSQFGDELIDVEHIISVCKRQWKVVALSVAIFFTVGLVYWLFAAPLYTSKTSILIDKNNDRLSDKIFSLEGISSDDSWVVSQVELLESQKIARSVSNLIKAADGAKVQKEEKDSDSWRSSLMMLFGFEASAEKISSSKQEINDREFVEYLKNSVRVDRSGKSYVLDVSFTSNDPQFSEAVARAYAKAYMNDQLEAKYDATRGASEWLQVRILELREKSLTSDRAVQKFKAKHGLISSDGKLVSDQQLTTLNDQLLAVLAETNRAKAKADRINNIIEAGDLEGAVTESLNSTIIADLRTKYLEASRQEADLKARVGAKHTQAIRLRNEMKEYQRLMFEELSRIAKTYQSDLDVAVARRDSLERQVTQATNISAIAGDAAVQLRELERESETYRNLYESFLSRYQESLQQQSFPVNYARIIEEATASSTPSAPKLTLIAALSTVLGLAIGTGIGAFREFRDRFVRTPDQLRDYFRLEPLGIVPLLPPTTMTVEQTVTTESSGRVIRKFSGSSNYVLEHPMSIFSETIRSAKIAIDLFSGKKGLKTIGIVSVLPAEGKSLFSINFAELLASQGSRVLLVDADLRNPGATREIGRHAEQGIVEALQQGVPVRELLLFNPETKMAFLPAVVKHRIPYSSELLNSPEMETFLTGAATVFDYVVFDLPPMGAIVDARAMCDKIDSYVLVVEWGRTARNVIKKALISNRAIFAKCAGAVLNKVDSKRMKMYQGYGSPEYYQQEYASYFKQR